MDANNLYCGLMQKFSLPSSEFELVDVKFSPNFETVNDLKINFVLEIDLDYPEDLHDMHRDFPLAPRDEKIDRNSFSECQMGQLDQAGISRVTTLKLVQTLIAEKKHTVHYITLKLYLDLGLKVTKVHRVLQFKQKCGWNFTTASTPELELSQSTCSKS